MTASSFSSVNGFVTHSIAPYPSDTFFKSCGIPGANVFNLLPQAVWEEMKQPTLNPSYLLELLLLFKNILD
jgi:hypothetical protein